MYRLALLQLLATACLASAPQCIPTEDGSATVQSNSLFLLGTHPDGSLAPPEYCLRLDNLGQIGGHNTADFTFACSTNDHALTKLYINDNGSGCGSVIIAGSLFGGVDTGSSWSNAGTWEVYMQYNEAAVTCNAHNVVVGNSAHHIGWLKPTYDVGCDGCSNLCIRAGTEIVLKARASNNVVLTLQRNHRGLSTVGGWGWLSTFDIYGQEIGSGARDWLFGLCDAELPTVEPSCPEPTTEEPVATTEATTEEPAATTEEPSTPTTCLSHQDCDDMNACTMDSCVGQVYAGDVGTCLNEAIPSPDGGDFHGFACPMANGMTGICMNGQCMAGSD